MVNLYKSTLKCKICGRTYGSDIVEETGICPVCTPKKYARAKRLFTIPQTKLQNSNQT